MAVHFITRIKNSKSEEQVGTVSKKKSFITRIDVLSEMVRKTTGINEDCSRALNQSKESIFTVPHGLFAHRSSEKQKLSFINEICQTPIKSPHVFYSSNLCNSNV